MSNQTLRHRLAEYPIEKVEVVDSSDDDTQDITGGALLLGETGVDVTKKNDHQGAAMMLNDACETASNETPVRADFDSQVTVDLIREAAYIWQIEK